MQVFTGRLLSHRRERFGDGFGTGLSRDGVVADSSGEEVAGGGFGFYVVGSVDFDVDHVVSVCVSL